MLVGYIRRCNAQSHSMSISMSIFLKALPKREPFLLCLSFKKQDSMSTFLQASSRQDGHRARVGMEPVGVCEPVGHETEGSQIPLD